MARKYANFYIARLSSDISASDVEIPITALPRDDNGQVIEEGKLVIDAKRPDKREVIGFTGTDGSKLIGVTRALGGTLATTHQRNATIEMTVLGSDLTEVYEVADIIGTDGAVTTDKLADGAVTSAKLSDTGWVTIPITNGEYANSTLQFRKLGGMVFTRGAIIKNSGNIPQTSWITIISNVGAEFRTPQYEEFSLPRGSSARLSAGGVTLEIQLPTSFNSSSVYAGFSYFPS